MPVITYFEDDDGDKWEVVEGRLWVSDSHSIADAREFTDFIYAELAKADLDKDATTKPDADGWIGHDGSDKCPVPLITRVELLRRDGKIYGPYIADGVVWEHKGWQTDIMRYRLSKAKPAKDAPANPDDGWIEWNGGECPVGSSERVDVTLRDGNVLFGRAANLWDWQHDDGSADIMRYRPAKGGAE